MVAKTARMPDRETIPGLADKLRSAREAAGLSQQQAADASGMYQATIARYETDERVPTLGALYKLADAYGVTVCELLPPAPKKRK
jgi:transcriptional regulator with XRE-family HTH domain